MNKNKTIINTLSEYVKHIEGVASKKETEQLLFRGQPVDELLLPKFGRKIFNIEKRLVETEQEMLSVRKGDIIKKSDIKKGPFRIQKIKVFQPTHIEDRFFAQDGWFTVHPGHKRSLTEKNYTGRLEGLCIPYCKFPTITKQLQWCGINDAHLFPDMDGLAKYIMRIHSKNEK